MPAESDVVESIAMFCVIAIICIAGMSKTLLRAWEGGKLCKRKSKLDQATDLLVNHIKSIDANDAKALVWRMDEKILVRLADKTGTPSKEYIVKGVDDDGASRHDFITTATNGPRTSPSGANRPDFLLYIGNLLVFRGEEKKQGAPISVAHTELTSKMEVWNPLFFGDIPYIIGYALAGSRFQLYALHPNARAQRTPNAVLTRSTPVSPVLDLANVTDRITLIKYMVNLVRVLQALAEMAPEDAPKLGGNYVNPRPYSGTYSALVFETAYVRKVLLNMLGSESFNFDALRVLYRLIEEKKIINTIKCAKDYPKSEDQRGMVLLRLHLYPLGRCVLPNSAESLKSCLLAVLDALASMHKHKFCHRDVRWPNIIQLADGKWMLIDLDYAEMMDRKGVAPWPRWISNRPDVNTWPPRDGDDGGWGKAKDVWMVGQLLEDMIEPNKPVPVAGVDLNSLAAAKFVVQVGVEDVRRAVHVEVKTLPAIRQGLLDLGDEIRGDKRRKLGVGDGSEDGLREQRPHVVDKPHRRPLPRRIGERPGSSSWSPGERSGASWSRFLKKLARLLKKRRTT
ncbi:hypothetical protein BASA81_008309 [Batrachochytrium salamandrivorans]|nr:hypothetical protein BASA81_008309 [Batrachochytrium salamandrivorans]